MENFFKHAPLFVTFLFSIVHHALQKSYLDVIRQKFKLTNRLVLTPVMYGRVDKQR